MPSLSITPLTRKIEQSVRMPGSKSYTNRALIMAALSEGTSTISGISESDDSRLLLDALQQFGITISKGTDVLKIIGIGKHFKPFTGTLNVGAAGTTMRFLTSLCTLIPGDTRLDGSPRMRQRPIGTLVKALRELGARIQYEATEGCPPIYIRGGSIRGGTVHMEGSTSSQYFTSLMLIAPLLTDGLHIQVIGNQVSRSYIDMTIDGLRQFHVHVDTNNYQYYSIVNQTYEPTEYHVEGDATGATYFWSIAALNGGTVRVNNINPRSAQGDRQFVDLLEQMGCTVQSSLSEQWISVTGTHNLHGIQTNMERMPDAAQTLAVVAAFATGVTTITGLSTLRRKETDRITALQKELEKMGVQSEVGNDWITIHGGKPHGAVIETYDDHRMAMSFAVAGTLINGIIIQNPSVVTKSFPTFWNALQSLGVSTL